MRSRDPKNVFIEEIAEINNTHEKDIIKDRVESSDTKEDVPVLLINLSSFHKGDKVGENVVLVSFLLSSPFVALHLEFLDKDMTAQDTQSVTDENIQDNRVPPAFSEVREPVLESEFKEFANITGAMDMFISAHFFGWFFKMLIVRDWKFCMFLSVFFEFLEITFKHWLPNFKECWWDSLILDVLVCNALGIYAGHLFIKRFQMKQFKWTKNMDVNKKNIFGNFYDFIRSTPIDKRDWHVFSNSKRFISVIYYMALMYAVDLSNFFNKYVLWLPASHYLLSIRIFLWGFLSLACTREYYEYISNNMFLRVGPFLFVGHMILFVEFSILAKFSWGTDYFSAPFPRYVVWSWAAIALALVTITLILFYRDVKNKLKEKLVAAEKVKDE